MPGALGHKFGTGRRMTVSSVPSIGDHLSDPNHWHKFHLVWHRMKPPLRPDAAVVAALRPCIAGRAERVLLLGVTQELADLSDDLTAVDRNQNMIDHIWPGDSATRRALCGDWLNMNFADARFSAVIGDGSLNNMQYPDGHHKLYKQLARVLRPGGRFASRVFATPDPAQSVREVCQDALRGRAGTFHGFKWRLAMSLVAEAGDPNLAVPRILEAFNAHIPDRERLMAATGWPAEDFATIDLYAGSTLFYTFPTRRQLAAVIPSEFGEVSWQEVGDYPLADCCPLLVMEKQ
jgi:SAM-dependent methyltransferase